MRVFKNYMIKHWSMKELINVSRRSVRGIIEVKVLKKELRSQGKSLMGGRLLVDLQEHRMTTYPKTEM